MPATTTTASAVGQLVDVGRAGGAGRPRRRRSSRRGREAVGAAAPRRTRRPRAVGGAGGDDDDRARAASRRRAATRRSCRGRSPPGLAASAAVGLVGVGPGQQHRAGAVGRAARRRWRRTARASCPGRRPPRAGPGAGRGGGRPGRSRGRRTGRRRSRATASSAATRAGGARRRATARRAVGVHVTILPTRDRIPPHPDPRRPARGSASSARWARSPSRRCSPSPTWPPAELVALPHDPRRARRRRGGRGRPRLRPHRERDRGHGQRHPGRAGLRPRPAHPARGRARRRAVPARPGRARRSADVKAVVSIPVATGAVPARSCDRTLPRRRAAGRQLDGRGGAAGRRGSRRTGVAAIGPEIAGRALRPRRAGRRHRGPRRQPDPLRRRRPATACPAPTGHDKTSLVVFQRADEPGQPASRSCRSSRPGASTCQPAGEPADEGRRPRRLLLPDRRRRPHRRRAGGRLPARPARQAGRA